LKERAAKPPQPLLELLRAADPAQRTSLITELVAQTLREEHADDAALLHAVEQLGAPPDARAAVLWRRRTGRFYTPPQTARRLAHTLLAGLTDPPNAIIDPACGGGTLLVAAYDELRSRWPQLTATDAAARLWGIDNDPAAVALCRARVGQLGARPGEATDGAATRIVVADGLAPIDELPVPAGHFDAVIANPPYGNAIESETARSGADVLAYRQRFPLAARGAYDRASLFVERALQLGSPTGHIAVLVPNAWRVAPSSRALRQSLVASHGPECVEELERSAFPEVANTLAIVAWKHAAPAPAAGAVSGLVTLGSLATVRAGMTTSEAYAVRDAVQEGGAGWRFVTAGAIDPFVVRWGRPQRYLGRTFQHPTLPFDAAPPRRAIEYRQPRVLVAALSRRLEAVADPDGTYAAAVSVVQVFPTTDEFGVDALAALLNRDDTRERYAASWQAAALGGSSIPVTPGRLRELLVAVGE
jgi:predicted RNA methylase